ncbi:unnamed protein product [Rangifer tarandus platyrhynchus]|uniref:Uncharacterized protein n=1 Tax=Rangifer tarandus platyrhynchus TaxID=3082113 RepID=A0AC59Z0N4_RANTA
MIVAIHVCYTLCQRASTSVMSYRFENGPGRDFPGDKSTADLSGPEAPEGVYNMEVVNLRDGGRSLLFFLNKTYLWEKMKDFLCVYEPGVGLCEVPGRRS